MDDIAIPYSKTRKKKLMSQLHKLQLSVKKRIDKTIHIAL